MRNSISNACSQINSQSMLILRIIFCKVGVPGIICMGLKGRESIKYPGQNIWGIIVIFIAFLMKLILFTILFTIYTSCSFPNIIIAN